MTRLGASETGTLRAALAAIDRGARSDARGAASALAAHADPRARAAGARVLSLLRDHAAALRALDAPESATLMRLRFALLKRLRFEEEASAALEDLLADPDPQVLHAAALHEESAGRPAVALAHLDRLAQHGGDASRWRWLRARIAARAGDRRAVEEAAAGAPLDSDASAELTEALLEVGSFEAAGALGGDATRAQLALWRGETDAALALADRAGAFEVAIGALLGSDRREEAARRLAAWTGPTSPTLALLRAELARSQGDEGSAGTWIESAKDRVPDYLAAKLLWVLVDGKRRPHARIDRFGYEGLLEGQLAALGVNLPLDAYGEVPRAALDAAAEEALARLGHNRTPRPTRLVDGALERVRIPASARHRARRAQHRAIWVGLDAATRELDAVLAELGDHPVAQCYRVELDLWAGRYELARDGFAAILRARRGTVWGWIGLGAAQTRLGDAAAALATLDEGARVIGWRGATMPVTRGEALLALGRHDEAAAELAEACRMHPGRVSAWALRVLCADARGDAATRERAFAHLDREAPALLADAADHAGVDGWWPGSATSAQQIETSRAALALMRGNRSSSCPAWLAAGSGAVRSYVHGRPSTTPAWEADERRALARLADA